MKVATILPSVLAATIAFATFAANAASVCLIETQECEALFKPKNKKLLALMQMSDAEGEKMGDVAAIQGAIKIVKFYDRFEVLQAEADQRCQDGEKATSLKGFDRFFVTGEGDYKRALMMRGQSECAWIKVR